jgi:hypothetical protein
MNRGVRQEVRCHAQSWTAKTPRVRALKVIGCKLVSFQRLEDTQGFGRTAAHRIACKLPKVAAQIEFLRAIASRILGCYQFVMRDDVHEPSGEKFSRVRNFRMTSNRHLQRKERRRHSLAVACRKVVWIGRTFMEIRYWQEFSPPRGLTRIFIVRSIG